MRVAGDPMAIGFGDQGLGFKVQPVKKRFGHCMGEKISDG
jgi:hypothetical protein